MSSGSSWLTLLKDTLATVIPEVGKPETEIVEGNGEALPKLGIVVVVLLEKDCVELLAATTASVEEAPAQIVDGVAVMELIVGTAFTVITCVSVLVQPAAFVTVTV